MTHDPLLDVTRLLSEAVRDPGDVGTVPTARNEAIDKLAGALRARARARRRRRIVGSVAVAAGAAALVGAGVFAARHEHVVASTDLGHVHEPTGAVTVVQNGHAATLGADAVVAEGSELRTPAGAEARLDFASGTRVTIGGETHVRLVEQSKKKRFALETGSLSAKVAKLRPGERFVVTTSDAEIEVHGTEFRVSVVKSDPSCGGGTPTRLLVTEGVVAVRHAGVERLVAAGDTWPRCNEPSSAVAPPTTPSAPPHAAASDGNAMRPPVAPPAVAHRPPAPAASAGTPLAEQNELYREAMRLKQKGRSAAAVATLDRLVERYPHGPLSESARLQRMRILAATERAHAAAAAKDYLERHPNGFGRTEAEALLAEAR